MIRLINTPPYYEIVAAPDGSKTYIALLSQSGTAAPTVTEIQNTIGNIIWTRDSTGIYFATLTGAFTENKTIAQIQNNQALTTQHAIYWNDINQIELDTGDSGIAQDQKLNATPVTITVYE